MARVAFDPQGGRLEPRHRPRASRKAFAIGIAAVLGAGAAIANAGVNMMQTRAPDLALMIDGDDPVALIRSAELKRAAGEEKARSDAAVLSAVQRSVKRLPINGPAFRLYGLSRATNADIGAMRAQMRVSDAMERRDIGTQLWLIENAAEENDVNRALRHYDTALRIGKSSRALLYPTLTNAMDSPLIRERFQPLMKANPPWLETFLRFAVSKTENPVALARLARLNGGWPQGAAFSSLDTELLARLVSDGHFAAAAEHFRGIEGADPSILTTLRLTDASTDPRLAPMTWQGFRIDGIETYILAAPQGAGAVEIEAEIEAGFKGPVARKFLALEPGGYRLSASLQAEDHSQRDIARWSVTCAGTVAEAALLREDRPLGDEMVVDATFTVTQDCPVQSLVVSAETLVTTRYVKLVLSSAQLRPFRSALDQVAPSSSVSEN